MSGTQLSDADLERGDGLHEERTALAWARSGLALVGAFAILARRVWTGGQSPTAYVAVALLGAAAFGWAIGILGWGVVHRRSAGAQPRRPGELLAVALGTVAVGLCGLVVTLVNL